MTRAQTTSTTQQNTGGAVVPFAAGKNKFINGDFSINQRGFSSTTTTATFGFDRWQLLRRTGDGTITYSAQAFTAGTAPVTGYEAKNYARIVTTGQTATNAYAALVQNIEDVRTLSGNTVTISFWAKANTGTPKMSIEAVQYFGTGGSPSADVLINFGAVTIGTSWARYSVTASIPSLSGKTVGTANDSFLQFFLWVSAGSDYNTRANSIGIQSNTFDMWGFQIESGSVATPFQTATGTIQGELAACQRYYIRINDTTNSLLGNGTATSTTATALIVNLPVSMRVRPTSIEYSSLQVSDGVTNTAVSSVSSGIGNQSVQYINAGVASGLTQYRPYYLQQNGSTGYLGFSAEL